MFFFLIKRRAATEIRSLNCIATNSKMSFYVSQRLTGSYLHCHKKSVVKKGLDMNKTLVLFQWLVKKETLYF